MITVITRWESTQMPELTEWQMWRQLRGAFRIDRLIFVPKVYKMEGYIFEQANTMEEALDMLPSDTPRCFLEPTGYNSLADLPSGDDIAFILGNTSKHNMEHAEVHETYSIATPAGPNKAHLYGINAAAIALAIRYGQ